MSLPVSVEYVYHGSDHHKCLILSVRRQSYMSESDVRFSRNLHCKGLVTLPVKIVQYLVVYKFGEKVLLIIMMFIP